MKNILAQIIISLAFISNINAQNIEQILQKIIVINEVQYVYVGDRFPLDTSNNYQNFIDLKKTADINSLLDLLNHKNSVIAIYASWALIDKGYKNLNFIYLNFSNRNEKVWTHSYDVRYLQNMSNLFYFSSYNRNAKEKSLIGLDSLILNQKNINEQLLNSALKHRLFDKKYNKRISELAFKENFIQAILYLSKWYRAEYCLQTKNALIKYLIETSFENQWAVEYLNIILELLKYNDPQMVWIIEEKLEEDQSWVKEKEMFISILNPYNIFINVPNTK